jgi:hypothetical protein
MPPDADVTRVSEDEFERWAKFHDEAAEMFRRMAEARRNRDYELMGEMLQALEALGVKQAQGTGGGHHGPRC